MHYEGVEYVVRASLGRDQWTLLIYFPDRADSDPTVIKFSGSRDEPTAAARVEGSTTGSNGSKRKMAQDDPEAGFDPLALGGVVMTVMYT
jgi:hypothetical protein